MPCSIVGYSSLVVRGMVCSIPVARQVRHLYVFGTLFQLETIWCSNFSNREILHIGATANLTTLLSDYLVHGSVYMIASLRGG